MSERIFDQIKHSSPEEVSVEQVLTRSVSEVLPTPNSLERRLREGPIKLYLGVDPTTEDMHIGHSVPLKKLRQFQDLGHEVVLLFGDFTGRIGDPTDKSAARVRLTSKQISENLATYKEQAGKILDLSSNASNPITIAYNNDWLGKMNFEEVVELMANVTVKQMMARRGFQERVEALVPAFG